MIKLLAAFVLFMVPSFAAAQTRTVVLAWGAATGATGYAISTASSVSGPFTQVGCTGTVPGSTCVSGSTSGTLTYQDTETIGGTVVYQLVAVGPACTSGSTPCGNSTPVVSTAIQIPPKMASPGSVTIVIQ
jgi:hypothetical protein